MIFDRGLTRDRSAWKGMQFQYSRPMRSGAFAVDCGPAAGRLSSLALRQPRGTVPYRSGCSRRCAARRGRKAYTLIAVGLDCETLGVSKLSSRDMASKSSQPRR